jgi:hypothetical protein
MLYIVAECGSCHRSNPGFDGLKGCQVDEPVCNVHVLGQPWLRHVNSTILVLFPVIFVCVLFCLSRICTTERSVADAKVQMFKNV